MKWRQNKRGNMKNDILTIEKIKFKLNFQKKGKEKGAGK